MMVEHPGMNGKAGKPLIWIAVGVGAVLFLFLYLIMGGLTDPNWIIWVDRDFSNYWIASRLVLEGKVLDLFSGQDVYFPHMQAAFGVDYPWHNWSYPPSYLFFVWPVGLLPHGAAMVLFLFATMLVFLHAVHVTEPHLKPASAVLLVPFLFCNIITAQNGFITSAMVLYGLALRDRSPVLAGIAIGLLTVKPQLGMLFPLLLLLERRWSIIFTAGITAVALVLLSGLVFGWQAWRGYIEHNMPYQTFVMTQFGGTFMHMMPSLFGALRSYLIPAATALPIHLTFAALIVVVFCIDTLRHRSRIRRDFGFLLATFLAIPYSLTYDLGALSALAAIAAHQGAQEGPFAVLRRISFTAVAFMPLLHSSLSTYLALPIAPFVMMVAYVILLSQRESAENSPVLGGAPTVAR